MLRVSQEFAVSWLMSFDAHLANPEIVDEIRNMKS
jgi:hypothetical protein